MPEFPHPINPEATPCLEDVSWIRDLEYPGAITNGNDRFVYANSSFLERYNCSYLEIDRLSPDMFLATGSGVPGHASSAKVSFLGLQPRHGPVKNIDFKGNIFNAYHCIFPIRQIPEARPIGFVRVSTNPGNEFRMLVAVVTQFCTNYQLATRGEFAFPVPSLEEKGGARRREILKLSKLGYSPKEVAGMMDISPSTVNVVKWRARKSDGTDKRIEKTIASE